MAQEMQIRDLIRFADFELDLANEELRKHGHPLKLQPQPFKILAYLASRPGVLITRQQLREYVWPNETFVDFDLAINQAVKQIRAVLNDDPEQPRIIATVPKRGYRFIGKLADIGSENTSQQGASEPPTRCCATTAPAH